MKPKGVKLQPQGCKYFVFFAVLLFKAADWLYLPAECQSWHAVFFPRQP